MKIKNLSVFTVAMIVGLLLSFTSTDVFANQALDNVNDKLLLKNSISIGDLEIDGDNKCGEGKCGSATKEGKKAVKAEKKEIKVTTEKKATKVTTSEGKCGEGKCGADKKGAKAEKKASKKETKEGKCGTGKCGVA